MKGSITLALPDPPPPPTRFQRWDRVRVVLYGQDSPVSKQEHEAMVLGATGWNLYEDRLYRVWVEGLRCSFTVNETDMTLIERIADGPEL